GVPPPLLLQGQVAGALPVQARRVRVVQRAIVPPGDRAEYGAAVAVQAGDVFDGEGAAVGDEQGPRPQQVRREQPVTLLADGGVAVVVAVQALTQDGDGTEFIDHRGDADLDELSIIAVAVRDVSRGHVAARRRRPGGSRRT